MTDNSEKAIAQSIDRCESGMFSAFENEMAARPEGAVRYDVIDKSPFHYCVFLRGNGSRVSRDLCSYLGEAYITEIGLVFECLAMKHMIDRRG